MRVLTWHGRNVPPELRDLPPGKYAVESVDRVPVLSAKEEAGLEAAMASLDRGQGTPADEVHSRLRSLVRKASVVPKRRLYHQR